MSTVAPLPLDRRTLIAAAGLAALSPAPARSEDAGATDVAKRPVVLVHGGWRGGWCWRRVADRLRRAGHPVWAPSLTGLADRSHLLSPAVTLTTHVNDIAGLIAWEDLTDVVLCGHSYGGMVITGVVEQCRDRVGAVVYLDAFLPEPGRSLLDHVPAEMRLRFLNGAASSGGLAVPPPPAAAFRVNASDQAWVDAKCTPHPLATFTEALATAQAREAVSRKVYVRASAYDSPALRLFARRVADDPSWSLIDIPAGHDLMIDRPDDVARILVEVAA